MATDDGDAEAADLTEHPMPIHWPLRSAPRLTRIQWALAVTFIAALIWVPIAAVGELGTFGTTATNRGLLGLEKTQTSIALHIALGSLLALVLPTSASGKSSSADRQVRLVRIAAIVATLCYVMSFAAMCALAPGGMFTMGLVGLIGLCFHLPSAAVLLAFVFPASLWLLVARNAEDVTSPRSSAGSRSTAPAASS